MGKSFLLFVILVLNLSAFVYSQPNDWANTECYRNKNQITERPSVVFIGNSITEGWYYQDSLFFKKHNFAGRGIGGQVSAQMLVRFRNDVLNLKPHAVVILAGINDIAQNNGYVSLENILNNIVSMVELARINGIEPVLCSVLPASEFPWRKELKPAQPVKELNEMIRVYAAKNRIVYVDYYAAMSDERGGLPGKYSSDGVHPNIEGYKVMETVLLPALKKYAK